MRNLSPLLDKYLWGSNGSCNLVPYCCGSLRIEHNESQSTYTMTMPSPKKMRQRMHRTQRFLGLVLVGMYALVVTGAPFPVASEISLQLVRFPCEDSACGCSSAKQCWRSCCCSTLEEKIIWARINGIVVPEDVLQHLPQKQTCCSAKKMTHAIAESCCTVPGSNNVKQQSGDRTVRFLSALGCGGNGAGLPAVIPAVFPDAFLSLERGLCEKALNFSPSFDSRFAMPPATPPPEYS